MSKQRESIISAGIDIGTSTTKLIISRLSLLNVAGISHVPRIEIVDKEILYQSPVYRTPLLDETTINTSEVEQIIQHEYDRANISPHMIETGAVIITGEAATKNNASEMVHYLSKEAGEFLVATAGPDLEGIIAAKGSGVFAKSKGNRLVRANVDIGGGTANIAVYKNEILLGTCTLHVGGRLIEFDHHVIKSISPPVRSMLKQEGIRLQIGDSHNHPHIDKVLNMLLGTLSRTLTNELQEKDRPLILGHKPDWRLPIDVVTFSGGVSECMYQLETIESKASYNDIGILLAAKIQQSSIYEKFIVEAPMETVRATVLGAGTQTTEISGATIEIDPSKLPLKNIPIIKHDFHEQIENGISTLEKTFQQARRIYDTAYVENNFALSLTNIPLVKFNDIQRIANEIKRLMNERNHPDLPIILVVESDLAKVLGQSLIAIGVQQPVISIDQIHVDTGDYIDIGKALKTDVVPVIVKTLTFHSSEQ
ncbi:ethanolamine ammonia-lyase reactivating factor EutA [Pseudogracilibacillus auburnensis]|uniref:ethanolamine ammonia-lyase reactivating factor EutA n=1 Tax=Pseudogracilibacillus auburnensis TaxID=1494959 RepID=UPI001A956780|nr:ethanolamine ammonia-lyase reactivating factor EutA [Pseudogracilibacillus auburnensis]MBO1001454.1 ethanolamine ammonia-lyase reactivating factor EutA [Pseudogracilibacillus auburnensis]